MTDTYTLAKIKGKWILFSGGTPFLIFDTEAIARRAKHEIEVFVERTIGQQADATTKFATEAKAHTKRATTKARS